MKIVTERYSSDNKYRFQVVDREDGTFQVHFEKRFDGGNWDYTLSSWDNIDSGVHLTDTSENAIKLGQEFLQSLLID